MQNSTVNVRDLLREFVASYVDKPDALRIEFQTAATGDVYWMMKGDFEDEGKLVGKAGTHVDALEFILMAIGRHSGVVYTFRLLTRGGCEKKEAPRDVIEYDPGRVQVLLTRLLVALGIGASVRVGPGAGPRNSLTFVFTIKASAREDYSRLVHVDVNFGSTIVAALGTLFRAIAKKDGVRFTIAAET
jgi:predicted RNA-binding protein YlqC (UPF0109 family)